MPKGYYLNLVLGSQYALAKSDVISFVADNFSVEDKHIASELAEPILDVVQSFKVEQANPVTYEGRQYVHFKVSRLLDTHDMQDYAI
mmetsp:Transcript_19912/g.26878  ORF Transcript_19912/g.26878 Transcript_19912/m.26878 type:complete len:87 (+) Transcript_19912:124-384(+)